MAGVPYIRDTGEAVALFPPTASANAPQVDTIFYTLVVVSVVMVLLIGVLILFFSIRYRAGAEVGRDSTWTRQHSHWIEIGWTVPTTILFLVAFFFAARLYVHEYRAPADAVEIHVIGKQWMWKIEHANGVREINTLHVPTGEDIKLSMTSQDVIHSFYIPAFRLKKDVLPDRYTTYWFKATRPGVYNLLCAEMCGFDHSHMRGRVVVMTPGDYQKWLARQDVPEAPAAAGRDLFTSYGCSGCHAPGSDVHAPNLAGLYGKPVQLAGGGSVTADDGYIRDSILLPRKDVVAGYQPIMPSFKGQVSEADILNLIAYIKSLGAKEEIRP